MEYVDRFRTFRLGEALGCSVARVLERARAHAADPLVLRRLKGVLMLLLSLPAGSFAYHSSRRAIMDAWMEHHGPATAAWKHALGARAFEVVRDADLVRRSSRTLPTLADQPGAAWISADGTWICVFPRDETSSPPVFFSTWPASEFERARMRSRKRHSSGHAGPKLADMIPKTWEPAGRSWPEFEALLSRLDRNPPAQPVLTAPDPVSPRRPTKPRPASDPREMLF